MGQYSDTITLLKRQISRFGQITKDYGDHVGIPDSSRMTIFVDTLFDLAHTEYYEHYPLEEDRIVTDSIKNYKAYPVLIKNITDSLLFISDCWDLSNMVRQVKTKNGLWRVLKSRLDICMELWIVSRLL
jgi:hypothetical protein